MDKYIEVDNKEINVLSLLQIIKNNKEFIEKGNMIIYLSPNFIKELEKKTYIAKSQSYQDTLTISSKCVSSDYHYGIMLKKESDLYKVIDVSTKDPEFDGCFIEPDYSMPIGILYITKKDKSLLPKKNR